MPDQEQMPQLVCCFYVNLAKSDGSAGIFIKAVNPDEIVKVESLPHGGSLLTEKIAGVIGEIAVVQSKDTIARAAARCREKTAALAVSRAGGAE